MTKFKPDSAEARAWVQFMAAVMSRLADAETSAFHADKALELFQQRLDEDEPLTKDQRRRIK